MRTATCQTADCENHGLPIDIPDAPPEGDTVVCGPCGQVIEDVTQGAPDA